MYEYNYFQNYYSNMYIWRTLIIVINWKRVILTVRLWIFILIQNTKTMDDTICIETQNDIIKKMLFLLILTLSQSAQLLIRIFFAVNDRRNSTDHDKTRREVSFMRETAKERLPSVKASWRRKQSKFSVAWTSTKPWGRMVSHIGYLLQGV